jgi:thymidylate kinase
MIIYLTGIDGSGKSTITEKLVKEIYKDVEVISIWARYKPKIVKALISPFKKKFVSDAANDHLMNSTEYSEWKNYKKKITKSGVVSKLIYCLQSVDYILQLSKVKKITTTHKDKVIVIDRYLLDFIVDESVNYGDIENNFITKYFLRRLKKIDYIFYIDTSEEVALSRKNDIPSLEYLRERKKFYKQYIGKLDNGHIINNDFNIADAMQEIKTVLNLKH